MLAIRSPLDDLSPSDLERMVLLNITSNGRHRRLSMIPSIAKGVGMRVTVTRLNNILRRQTQRRGYDFGSRGGTPPRKKTVARLAMQRKFNMSGFAVRLTAEQGGGHPTKKHTEGRMN